jgi:hypothetical protein
MHAVMKKTTLDIILQWLQQMFTLSLMLGIKKWINLEKLKGKYEWVTTRKFQKFLKFISRTIELSICQLKKVSDIKGFFVIQAVNYYNDVTQSV